MLNILHIHDYPLKTGGGLAYFIHDLISETDDIAQHNIFSTRCKDDIASDDKWFVGDYLFKKYDLIFFHFTYSIRLSFALLILALLFRQRIYSVMHCEKEHIDHGNLKYFPKPIRNLIAIAYEFLISLDRKSVV